MNLPYESANAGDRSSMAARRRRLVALGLAFALLCSGCATFNGAGKTVIDQYGQADETRKGQVTVSDGGAGGGNDRIPTLESLLTYNINESATIEAKRNAYLSREIIEIDQQYDKFVRALYQNRTRTDLGTALLQLFLGVAGTLTDSTGVHKNYAAGSALVTGSNVAIDKNVFLDKTVSAIISSMDAQRGRALVRLRQGMGRPISEYPIVAAQADLYAYQRAGSMLGGLSFIEERSQEDAQASASTLRRISVLTPSQATDKLCVSKSLDALLNDGKQDQTALRAVAAAVGIKGAEAMDETALVNAIGDVYADDPTRIASVQTQMSEQHLMLPTCPKDQ